jgi:hypothetical protein
MEGGTPTPIPKAFGTIGAFGVGYWNNQNIKHENHRPTK